MNALVLIVEDNEKNMKLARDVLTFKGFRILGAGSAEDGITLASEQRPDLILMDIQLPGMDGIAALKVLRSRPDTASIPVIAFTASVMKEDRERFTAAGFDGHIMKPIDVREFPDQVRRFAEVGRKS